MLTDIGVEMGHLCFSVVFFLLIKGSLKVTEKERGEQKEELSGVSRGAHMVWDLCKISFTIVEVQAVLSEVASDEDK